MSEALIDDLFARAYSHCVSAQELAQVARLEAKAIKFPDVERAVYNGRHSPSIHLLTGYAFELLLKVAYLAHGGDVQMLTRRNGKGIGHDLVRALDYAEAAGFVSSVEKLRWTVEHLNPMHEQHRFRYGGSDYVEMPSLEISFEVLGKLTTEIAPHTFVRR